MSTVRGLVVPRQRGAVSSGFLMAIRAVAVLFGVLCVLEAWPAPLPASHEALTYPPLPILPNPIPLELSFSGRLEGITFTVEGKSNLPDGTELIVAVRRVEPLWNWTDTKVVVSGGRFVAHIESRDSDVSGRPLTYDITVVGPLVDVQPVSVQTALGADYSNYLSPYIQPMYGHGEDRGTYIGRIIEMHQRIQIR